MKLHLARIGWRKRILLLSEIAFSILIAWQSKQIGGYLQSCGWLLFVWCQIYYPMPGFRKTLPEIYKFYKHGERVLRPKHVLFVMLVSVTSMLAGSVISFVAQFH